MDNIGAFIKAIEEGEDINDDIIASITEDEIKHVKMLIENKLIRLYEFDTTAMFCLLPKKAKEALPVIETESAWYAFHRSVMEYSISEIEHRISKALFNHDISASLFQDDKEAAWAMSLWYSEAFQVRNYYLSRARAVLDVLYRCS